MACAPRSSAPRTLAPTLSHSAAMRTPQQPAASSAVVASGTMSLGRRGPSVHPKTSVGRPLEATGSKAHLQSDHTAVFVFINCARMHSIVAGQPWPGRQHVLTWLFHNRNTSCSSRPSPRKRCNASGAACLLHIYGILEKWLPPLALSLMDSESVVSLAERAL